MKKTINNVLKCALISISTLIIGFIAISLPFNLFEALNPSEMRIIFILEIVIYSILFAMFFLVKEKKQERAKIKAKVKLDKEKKRVQLLKDLEQFNMVA